MRIRNGFSKMRMDLVTLNIFSILTLTTGFSHIGIGFAPKRLRASFAHNSLRLAEQCYFLNLNRTKLKCQEASRRDHAQLATVSPSICSSTPLLTLLLHELGGDDVWACTAVLGTDTLILTDAKRSTVDSKSTTLKSDPADPLVVGFNLCTNEAVTSCVSFPPASLGRSSRHAGYACRVFESTASEKTRVFLLNLC